MGHPKLKSRKFSKPLHPWQKERIEEEKQLLADFGLKNKEEVWKANSLLSKYAKQAKNLIALTTPQAELTKQQLLSKMNSLGLVNETAKIEDILTITVRDILSRRLETFVHRNGLARTIRQARQLITHEHILVAGEKITSPSYIVSRKEEALIEFAQNSPFFSIDHPERAIKKEMPVGAKKEEKAAVAEKPRRDNRRRREVRK
ncbi:MAG TPA: 30S ribosomal protein S4 [Candidatus Nanoarchaeia archaeon]|nr:30S ribosomal protein S4 [Candidatus Nanoarchaeia archaeon]